MARVNMTVPGTEYGTGALAHDHRRIPRTRRPLWHYGVVTLGVVATVAMLTSRSPRMEVKMEVPSVEMAKHEKHEEPKTEGVIPPTSVESAIECWQSSYREGKTEMMEEITGLTWKPTSEVEAKEEARHEKKEEKAEAKETKKEDKKEKHKHKHEKEDEEEDVDEEIIEMSKFELGSKVTVDAAQVFQEIVGFGGAFTEASALQFHKLSAEKQQKVLELYFSKENGSNYQLGRVPMGSTDFSVDSYNYDDVVNDTELVHFDENVTRDSQVLIPLIKAAIQKNPNLKLLLAPWSPPAWMKYTPVGKAGPNMTGSAKPVGLNAEFRQSWALYFSKFITAYKKKEINFWALTPQNEPEFAAPWEGCVYTPEYEADFVGGFLGPVIKRDHPELKLLVFDHNRDHITTWAKTITNHPTAKNFVDGIAFHWYDNQRYMDGVEYHEHLNDTHAVLPASSFILASEACNCPGVADGDEAWFRAQRYAHDIITDMNNWVAGWIDWNLILDHKGGPNHLGNICDAPLIMNKAEDDFYIQPMYYFIQHFSKFVDPGSHRIKTDVAAKFSKPGDAQLYPRYPSAIYSCDGSSRQLIEVTEDKKLQISGTKFCIDVIHQEDTDPQVELVVCKYTPRTYEFVNGTIRMDNKCLQLKQGSTDNGARVVIGDCVDNADWQKWEFKDGVMHSLASDKCVTAGYAFVQAVSFVTPANKKVTVVLNENTEHAKFDLNFGNQTLKTVVPAGAIRTFTWA